MRLRPVIILTILVFSAALWGCAARPTTPSPASVSAASPTLPPDTSTGSVQASTPPTETPAAYRTPPLSARWQIQYTGEMDTHLEVDVFNLDLFDTDPSVIAQLHERGIFVMCYFSAGSFEDWRPDADRFPIEVLGRDLEGWPGERWLDIRRMELLTPIIEARLDLAVEKGCDGVDPDNVDGYSQETGFPLTATDQLHYNLFLAEAAHTRALSIGLKNDLEQIPDLLPYFDWALNEQCFYYEECELLLPFVEAGKPVFNIEYELEANEFCPQANAMNFNSLRKNYDLDAYRQPCR